MPFVFIPDPDGIRELMQSDEIRAELHDVAEKILPVAQRLAGAAKQHAFQAALKLQDGTRPKGRPYSRVIADYPDGEKVEFGDTAHARRRILGQAANIKG